MALFLPPSRGFSEKDFDGLPQLSKLSPADMQRIKSVYSAGNFPGGTALPFAFLRPLPPRLRPCVYLRPRHCPPLLSRLPCSARGLLRLVVDGGGGRV